MKGALPALLSLSLAACAAQSRPSPPAAAAPAPAAVAAAAAPPTHPVFGTSWRVVSYFDGQRTMASPLVDAPIDAHFDLEGRLSGNAGCNNYTGGYRLEGAAITIGPMAATRRFCPAPQGVMDQESRYLEALQSAAIVRSDGVTMQLRTAQDALAVHLARDAAPPAP